MDDRAATKVNGVREVAVMGTTGVSPDKGASSAQPAESLKALIYYEGSDFWHADRCRKASHCRLGIRGSRPAKGRVFLQVAER